MEDSGVRRHDALTREAAESDSLIRNVGNRLESSRKYRIHTLDVVRSVDLFIYLFIYTYMGRWTKTEGGTDGRT